jgi:hypothetical protein
MCDICGKQHDMFEVTENELRKFVMEKDAQHIGICKKCFEEGIDYEYVTHWKVNGNEDNMFYFYRTHTGELIAWYSAACGCGYKAEAVR